MTHRYERKYAFASFYFPQVKSMILTHPYGFKTHYPSRYVHNVYFDTLDLTHFWDNIDGHSLRQKVRLRHYTPEHFTQDTFKGNLEIKKKNAEVGTKEVIPIKEVFTKETLRTISDQFNWMNNYFPVLINQYKRHYFLSLNGKYRVTLDENLVYRSFNDVKNIKDTLNVLEIKYDIEKEADLPDISHFLNIRSSKNSKYCRGIQMTNLKAR
ncbi:MAG: VTC domain-containing protein [Candidatus Margulisbacteria bacterium]|nr:VTC domain-containing protein [Candidatus Margulisiibacteriota bacterium]